MVENVRSSQINALIIGLVIAATIAIVSLINEWPCPPPLASNGLKGGGKQGDRQQIVIVFSLYMLLITVIVIHRLTMPWIEILCLAVMVER
jgi:hypothetical protein